MVPTCDHMVSQILNCSHFVMWCPLVFIFHRGQDMVPKRWFLRCLGEFNCLRILPKSLRVVMTLCRYTHTTYPKSKLHQIPRKSHFQGKKNHTKPGNTISRKNKNYTQSYGHRKIIKIPKNRAVFSPELLIGSYILTTN